MTCARFLLAFAVVVGTLAAPLNPVGAIATSLAIPAQTNAEQSDTLSVELVPRASGILRPGSDLTVSVTLSNRSDDTVAAGTARLYLGRDAVKDHLALARWISEETTADASGARIAEVPTPTLDSGQSVVLPAIVVPAAALVLDDPAAFGVHELEVRVSFDDRDEVGARSSVTVDPGIGGPAASVATVMPLTVSRETVGLISAEELQQLTEPGGMLARELDQADGRAIALAVDPRIILSIRVLGDSAPDSAVAWLDRLDRVSNVTFALSYADSDVAATSQAGAGILTPTPFQLDPGLFPSTIDTEPSTPPSASPSPDPTPSASAIDPEAPVLPSLDELLAWDYTLDDLIWPREMSVVSADLDTFAAAGDETALLTSTNLVSSGTDSAPSPLASLGTREALISDAAVSALFREAVTATTTSQWESAIARLTGSLAAIAAEGAGPGESQFTVASLSRDSASGAFRLAETLDAISANSWSTAMSLTSALFEAPVPSTLLDTPTEPARLAKFRTLLASESQTASFASILADPTLVTGERRLALLALSSQSWAATDADWATSIDAYLARSGEIVSSVQVDTTGTITVLADNGDLPISISNTLDFPITVYVTVTSPRLLLQVRETQVPVTIEANSQKRASIPVRSLANGEVTISIALTSATGVQVGERAFADVTVRAGWETAATTVLAVLVGLVFIAGIVRTVRRRKNGRGLTADRPDDQNSIDVTTPADQRKAADE